MSGRALVTGGAGFIGSHLCRALLDRGLAVIAVDNLLTGTERNLRDCLGESSFRLLRHDIICPLHGSELEAALDDGAGLDYVFHMASPASPPDYLRLPLETMLVNSEGTRQALEAARVTGAKFLFASTSEVYGDPLVHPQREDYWGNVNPNGVRSVYDEAKRFGEAMVMHYHRSGAADVRMVCIFIHMGHIAGQTMDASCLIC